MDVQNNKYMRKTVHYFLGIVLLLASCRGTDGDYDASGVFETTEVTVSAKGTGELLQFDVHEGDIVQAGQIVGYIDTLQLSLKREELLGNLQATDSRRYNVNRQIASLRQQIATQQHERLRYENLLRDNAANRKQLDDINSNIDVLEKQLAAQIEILEQGNRSVSGQVRMLEAQIAQVDDRIHKCIINSPCDGSVLAKYVEPGELAVEGKALFKVGNLTDMYLRVYITAPQLTVLQIGQSVHVFADMGENDRREYSGIVSWISDQAEFTPKTIQTRDERANLVYAVKVSVKNDGYIKRGMYGEVKIDKE